jgi:hypothetical protein
MEEKKDSLYRVECLMIKASDNVKFNNSYYVLAKDVLEVVEKMKMTLLYTKDSYDIVVKNIEFLGTEDFNLISQNHVMNELLLIK